MVSVNMFISSVSFINRKALTAWDRQRYEEVEIQIGKLYQIQDFLMSINDIDPIEQIKSILIEKKEIFNQNLVVAINSTEEIGIEDAKYFFSWIKSTKRIFNMICL